MKTFSFQHTLAKLIFVFVTLFLVTVPSEVRAQFEPQYELDVAIEIVPAYIEYFGSREAALLQAYSVLALADKILREQVGIRLNLVFENVLDDAPPYSRNSLVDHHFDFVSFWRENLNDTVQQDLAILFADPVLGIDFDRSAVTVTGDPCIGAALPAITLQTFEEESLELTSLVERGDDLAAAIAFVLGVNNSPDFCADTGPDWILCFTFRSSHRFAPETIAVMRSGPLSSWSCLENPTGELTSVLPLLSEPELGNANDTDGDGVSNTIELADETNVSDRGSFKNQLESPIYASWNGFLGMTNILETINTGSSALPITLTLFTLDGTQGETLSYQLAPGEQQDIVVNSLGGFAADTYGTLKIEFSGELDGRVFYYKNDPVLAGDYSFAYGIPFLDPSLGPVSVAFNTFQPSANASDSVFIVPNWLSIVNLASMAKRYTVFKFDQVGTILDTTITTVGPFARFDLEAGHVTPGPSNVGLMQVVPDDNTAPYLSFITRFGTGNGDEFRFAFPLLARAGTGETIHAPISNRYNAQNWLEVINTIGSRTLADVAFYSSAGALLNTQQLNLAPYAQIHLNASQYYGADQSGFATVTGSKPDSLLVQSMYYFRDPAGGIDAMYGSQAREADRAKLTGSYNLFLNMGAELTLVNPHGSSYTGTVSTQKPGLITAQDIFTLGAQGSSLTDLRTASVFDLTPSTYGVVEVLNSSAPIISELVRVRISPYHGRVDFAAPTAVR